MENKEYYILNLFKKISKDYIFNQKIIKFKKWKLI
jgi:hypothetical protein